MLAFVSKMDMDMDMDMGGGDGAAHDHGGPHGHGDGVVWKDTVLLGAGQTVDLLLDVSNPGRWMAHCHIAEHHESGMMFSFDVAPAAAGSRT